MSEELVVRQCAPTLAGIKTGSLELTLIKRTLLHYPRQQRLELRKLFCFHTHTETLPSYWRQMAQGYKIK